MMNEFNIKKCLIDMGNNTEFIFVAMKSFARCFSKQSKLCTKGTKGVTNVHRITFPLSNCPLDVNHHVGVSPETSYLLA